MMIEYNMNRNGRNYNIKYNSTKIELQQSNLSKTIMNNWLDNYIFIGTKYGTSSRGQTNSIVFS